MSQTVAAAGNGQSFLDEVQAAAAEVDAERLTPRATIRPPEERWAAEVGADAPPGPSWPPPPPPHGVSSDGRFGAVNLPSQPGPRPPTEAEAAVVRAVQEFMANGGVKPPKPAKTQKPPKDPAEPGAWARLPRRAQGCALVAGTLLFAGAVFKVSSPAYPDVQEIVSVATKAGRAGAREETIQVVNEARASATQVVVTEPFAEWKPAELNDLAKSAISKDSATNFQTLNSKRAEIVAVQVRNLMATGQFKLSDLYLMAIDNDLRVLTHPQADAVQLFKAAPTGALGSSTSTPPSTPPTSVGG